MGLFESIRQVVRIIPKGKVLTYGQVASRVGIADARKVGWALYGNKDPTLPCHRVVGKGGRLAKKFSLGGLKEQRKRLLREGVVLCNPTTVDMVKCGGVC